MRILFFLKGNLWRHTLPTAFKALGHEVAITNTLDEQCIKELIQTFSPNLVMSIGWGSEQTLPNQIVLRRCAKFSKVPHIYWALEDPAYTYIFSLQLIQRIQPDFVFTISQSALLLYQKLHIPSAYMDFGFSPHLHHLLPPTKEYSCDLAIVAGAYPHILTKYPDHYRNQSLQTLVTPLLKNGYRIDFWGKYWEDMSSFFNFDIPDSWIHGTLDYEKAPNVYSSAKIILGLQNYPFQLTQRTYEILATQGFLLTSDTPAIRNLFTPGKHLAVSASPSETLDQVNYYLSHPHERQAIAASAKSVLTGFSYLDRAQYMLDTLISHEII